jgi:membrane protein YqaA with SNARE-associated domain
MWPWTEGEGLAALFGAAFVSATLLPANSEVALAAFLRAFPSGALLAVLVATLGNTLGGLTTYGLGRLVPARYVPRARALAWVRRHGAAALLLSWIPLVGDALCAAAGWLRVPVLPATIAMAVGKLARYAAIAIAMGAFQAPVR